MELIISSVYLWMPFGVLAVLAVLAWAVQRRQAHRLQSKLDQYQQQLLAAEAQLDARKGQVSELESLRVSQQSLLSDHAALQERHAQEQLRLKEQQALLQEAQAKLSDAFKSLSADALRANNQNFLELATQNLKQFQQGAREDLAARQKSIEQMTQPIREKLEKFDTQLGQMEKARVGAYEALNTQVKELVATHLPRLHAETANLVKALRQPSARGRWGEVQLRRVVEMAGMQDHCDFEEQASRSTEDGRLRPDLIVRLPGGRQIVVDAKAPVDAYLTAVEARDDPARDQALAQHAQQVRTHVTQLARKAYFEQFDPSPEFVVLFVPGEAFFSAALAQDPELIEYGASSRVIPASPTTLIALLKAVAYGWRQEALAANAQQVAELGRELYGRLSTMAKHWSGMGQQLDRAVESYNKATASLDSRVMVTARKFVDLRAASEEKMPALGTIDKRSTGSNAPELSASGDQADNA